MWATARGDLEEKEDPLQERSRLCGFADSLDGLSFLLLSALRAFAGGTAQGFEVCKSMAGAERSREVLIPHQ